MTWKHRDIDARLEPPEALHLKIVAARLHALRVRGMASPRRLFNEIR